VVAAQQRRLAAGADGSSTPEILATQADRLANWRTLQELAGLRGLRPAGEPAGG
jgi:hypothetical protein